MARHLQNSNLTRKIGRGREGGRQTDRQTGRQTDRKRHSDRKRQTGRQVSIETDRPTEEKRSENENGLCRGTLGIQESFRIFFQIRQ